MKGIKSVLKFIFNEMVKYGYLKKNNKKFFEGDSKKNKEEGIKKKERKKSNKNISNPIKNKKNNEKDNKNNRNYKKKNQLKIRQVLITKLMIQIVTK